MRDLEHVKKLLSNDGRLINLPAKGKAVFVGDTHGDFEATETVFRLFFKPGYTLIFLGDYVDRGRYSRENIEFLLRKKIEAPKQVFLLMGNHEAYSAVPFFPADFWESLSLEENKYFSEIFQFLSFAVVTDNGIIGVHGIPPDVHELKEIKDIQYGSPHWHQVTWGDFVKMPGDYLGNYGGRPVYGEDYFNRKMKEFKSNVLIRAHQPHIDSVIFQKHCLTLMTSHAYKPVRLIAIADLKKKAIRTVDELELREI
jgi:serine/threonine-protein phosphatase 4 catalytic subunit